MIHLAHRPEKGARVKDLEYRIGGRGRPGGTSPDSLVGVVAKRIGIEKHGDSFALFVSLEGEPARTAPASVISRASNLSTACPSSSVRCCQIQSLSASDMATLPSSLRAPVSGC
jgi:hypothetical protein